MNSKRVRRRANKSSTHLLLSAHQPCPAAEPDTPANGQHLTNSPNGHLARGPRPSRALADAARAERRWNRTVWDVFFPITFREPERSPDSPAQTSHCPGLLWRTSCAALLRATWLMEMTPAFDKTPCWRTSFGRADSGVMVQRLKWKRSSVTASPRMPTAGALKVFNPCEYWSHVRRG
jgi:hypothetical protein